MKARSRVMRQRAQRLGHWAEWQAMIWLWCTGHRVLAHRWVHASGEIDIVARKGGLILFVEVKARASHVQAADALSARQWQRIVRASHAFLRQRGLHNLSWQYDCILIAPWRLPQHIARAWQP